MISDKGKQYAVFKRKGAKFFYVQFKKSDGTWTNAISTKETAKGRADQFAVDYLLKNEGRIVNTKAITFEQFSKNFFSWTGEWATDKKSRGLRISENHCMQRTDLLKNHINPAIGKLKLSDINRAVIKEFRNNLYNAGYSGNTINKCLSAVKTVLEVAEEKELIPQIPRIDRAAENPKEKGILTIEEVKQLFAFQWSDDIRGYVASKLAASSGLRLGEIQALTFEDLHLNDNYIHVRRSWDKRLQTFTGTTKTGKAANIFIPQNVIFEIENLIHANPYGHTPGTFLFYAEKSEHKPAEPEIFTRSLYRALEQIGIDEDKRKKRNITFHSWRHFLNSLLINKKIPLQKVQAFTRHSTIDMSNYYYKIDEVSDVLQITDNLFS